jgi:fatty-acyl-CoA synthase
MSYPHATFAEWLDAMAAGRPEHSALIDRDIPVSYAQLRLQVRRLAAGLGDLSA